MRKTAWTIIIGGVLACAPPPAAAQTPGSKLSTVTFPVEEDHYFESEGARLHGKFFAPAKTGKFPAIVYVTGGGDYSLMVDAYARNTIKAFNNAGIAVFMFDKRGQGKSAGSYPADENPHRTADAIAAYDRMARLPQVDSSRLGVWALSQAGWFVAPVMAQRPDADLLILLSPGGEPELEWFASYSRPQLIKAGIQGAELKAAEELLVTLLKYHGAGEDYDGTRAALAAVEGKPWLALARKTESWTDLPATAAELKTPDQLKAAWAAKPADYEWLRVPAHRQDHSPAYAGIRQPTLLIYGDADTLVDPAKSAAIFAKAWKGRQDKTIVTFWDAGHGIQRRGNAENPMPEYLDMATAWAKRHFKSGD